MKTKMINNVFGGGSKAKDGEKEVLSKTEKMLKTMNSKVLTQYKKTKTSGSPVRYAHFTHPHKNQDGEDKPRLTAPATVSPKPSATPMTFKSNALYGSMKTTMGKVISKKSIAPLTAKQKEYKLYEEAMLAKIMAA